MLLGVSTGRACAWLNLTRIFWLGKNQNRNQPVLMVGSSGSGRRVSGWCQFGFGFCHRFRYFIVGADVRRISLDLADIWLDLSNLE